MATRVWIGGADWNDPAGWGGTVPGAGDVAVVYNGQVPVAGQSGPVQSLQIVPVPDYRIPLVSITGALTITGELYNRSVVYDFGQLTAGSLDNSSLIIGDDTAPARSARADVTTITNGGTVALFGGTTGQATLDVHGAVPTTGYYALSGNALMQVSGAIGALSFHIGLDGAGARVAVAGDLSTNSALAGLAQVNGSGEIDLFDGASLSFKGDLLNQGVVTVSSPDVAALSRTSRFAVAGLLTNNGGLAFTQSSVVRAARLVNNNSTYLEDTSAVSFGTAVNNGSIVLYGLAVLATGSYVQTANGSLALENSAPQDGRTPVVASSGGAVLRGTLDLQDTLVAGRSFTAMTFAPGQLTGMFDRIGTTDSSVTGSGTVLTSPDGKTKSGLIYDAAAGVVRFVSVAAPSTTLDTFQGGSGSWTAATHWSAGAPTFYSDAVIGNAAVSLATDATVNSIALKAGASLTTASGTDLSVGATLAVAAGTSLVVGGQATVDSAFTDAGTVSLGPQALLDVRGNASGGGVFTIGAGGTLIIRAADSDMVSFSGAGATLQIDRASDFKGTLANLVAGDVIDLAGVKVASASDDGRTLTVRKADTSTAIFAIRNKQAGTAFAVQDDGAGGSKLLLQATSRSLPAYSGALAAAAAAPPVSYALASRGIGVAAIADHAIACPEPHSVLT